MTHKQKAARFNRLIQQAAKAWEDGNNSGDPNTLQRKDLECDRLRREAETLLPSGSRIYYPGLYPVVTRNGQEHYEITYKLWA